MSEKLRQLLLVATEIAVTTPPTFTEYQYLVQVRKADVLKLRRALDGLGVDWRGAMREIRTEKKWRTPPDDQIEPKKETI